MTDRWALFDRRTGRRVGVGTYSTQAQAEQAIASARYRSTRSRPDLLDVVDHLEPREVRLVLLDHANARRLA